MEQNYIVVVDSDEISNFILEKLFKDLGIGSEVKFFRSVEDGINFIYDYSLENNHDCPELIFVALNTNMAGKDGSDFLEIFRYMKFTNKKNVKLAVLSDVYPDYIRKMKGVKFKILLKPITKNQLQPLFKN